MIADLSAAESRLVLTKRGSGARYALFVAAIVLLPSLMLLLAVPIARTDWFVRRSQDLYFANLGDGLTLERGNCDVVIYGDSSALTGVVPAVIQEQTGLNTC